LFVSPEIVEEASGGLFLIFSFVAVATQECIQEKGCCYRCWYVHAKSEVDVLKYVVSQ
jgi:hypothetical protein